MSKKTIPNEVLMVVSVNLETALQASIFSTDDRSDIHNSHSYKLGACETALHNIKAALSAYMPKEEEVQA